MEEILKELETLTDEQKIDTLKKIISEKRKKISFYVASKNMYVKLNNIPKAEEMKEYVKELNSQIYYLQKLKTELTNNMFEKSKKKSHKSNRKKEQKIEFALTEEELELLNKFYPDEHINILTNFDNIESTLLEYLESIKSKYISFTKKQNKKIKKLKRSINILKELSKTPNKELEEKLRIEIKVRKILYKIVNYLDKLIHLEYKRINKINREQKRLIETLFAEKYGITKEVDLSMSYQIDELYSSYYELVFKHQDMKDVTTLLDQFPDLFLLKNNKRFLFEDILDRFANILLNKKYIGKSEKEQKAYNELEYYTQLIVTYLSYSFQNNINFIPDYTVCKLERILTLLNSSNVYEEKTEIILEQVNYLKEIIKLGNMSESEDTVKEVTGEYIFSIDSEGTKVIEDAVSISKDKDCYHINFYIPDLVSFIPKDSVLNKKAINRYKRNNYSFQYDIVQFFKLIQGRKKRVIGYHFVIDSNGELIDLKVEKNKIKLYNSFSFEEFNELFVLRNNESALLLSELFTILENKQLSDINYSSSTIWSNLILDFGSILGKYLHVNGIPCLYKNLSDGTITTVPNEDYYVEFTSPLRSYVSFLNERILLEQKRLNNLDSVCSELNEKLEQSQKNKEKRGIKNEK